MVFFIDIPIYVKVCYLVFIKGSTFGKYDHLIGYVHWMSKLCYLKKKIFFKDQRPYHLKVENVICLQSYIYILYFF